MRSLAILREAIVTARSQPVASALTILMITGMVLAVMLTTGRTVGAEQQVLGSLDDLGTRSIVIRAESSAGVTSSVLDRIAVVDGIEWAAAFTSAVDATNTLVLDGTKVATRYAYGSHLDILGIPASSPDPGHLAYASSGALERLGLPDVAGSITLTTGTQYGVGGQLTTPDFLAPFEPLVLIPQPTSAPVDDAVNVVIVIADSPELVAPVSDAVLSVIGADDPTKVTVQTSEALAELRGIIQGQLGAFSRGLVVILLAVTGALVAIILFGLVMMRRKDFGRRRALGASRRLIVGLLLLQTGALGLVGTGLGVAASSLALVASSDPLPSTSFILALSTLTLVTALLAAVAPAVAASRREPIRELRVP